VLGNPCNHHLTFFTTYILALANLSFGSSYSLALQCNALLQASLEMGQQKSSQIVASSPFPQNKEQEDG